MKMSNNYIRKVLIIVAPIAIYLIFGYVFNGKHTWMLFFVLSSIFVLSIALFNKVNKYQHFKMSIILMLPLCLILLYLSFSSGYSRSILYLILIPISVFLAWLYFRIKSIWIPIFSLSLFLVAGTIILPNVLVLLNSSNSSVNKDFNGISLIDQFENPVKLDDSKIVVLDFWTTSCAICFEKFPDYEKYYMEFKSNPQVKLYSINVPLKGEKFNDIVSLVNELDYKFPTLYATSIQEAENLGIYAYPHILIIKNGKIRYEGMLVTKKYIFINHLKTEIKRLIEE